LSRLQPHFRRLDKPAMAAFAGKLQLYTQCEAQKCELIASHAEGSVRIASTADTMPANNDY
jgi:hypothetical protein